MAFVVARRSYRGSQVVVTMLDMPLPAAANVMSHVITFPGRIPADQGNGSLGIVVQRQTGEIVTDTLWIDARHAAVALIRLGVSPAEAYKKLSDDYATWWLAEYESLADLRDAA